MRRLRLAGRAGGSVEREAAIAVLGQAIDRAVIAGRDREVLGGEELGLGRQTDHHALDLLERRLARAMAGLQAADVG